MFSLEDGGDMHGEICHQPYLLQVELERAQHLPKAGLTSSHPFVLLRLGDQEVDRSTVVKWTVNPSWNESFTIPLLHVQQVFSLEVWDRKSDKAEEILGKITFELQEMASNTLLHDNFPLQQAGRVNARGLLTCGIYLEKRNHMIRVSPVVAKNSPSQVLEHIHPPELSILLKQEYKKMKTLPSIQEAVEKSDLLMQKDFNFSQFRDIVQDMQNLSCDLDISNTDVPMVMHRIDDTTVGKHFKSTRINMTTKNLEKFQCPFLKHGMNSFVIETEEKDVILVASNQFIVWSWLRNIRRSFVKFQLKLKQSDTSNSITAGDLHARCHACGPIAEEFDDDDDDNTNDYFITMMHLVIKGKLHKCTCRLDKSKILLTCVMDDSSLPQLNVSLCNLKSICIFLDQPEHDELRLRCDLMSSKFILSRASRESSFNEKSTMEQLKHGMTLVTSFSIRIIINFLNGRELISTAVDGISPFWDLSTTISINSTAFVSSDGMDTESDTPSVMLVSAVTGVKGNESVLGTNIISYRELCTAEAIEQIKRTVSSTKSSFNVNTTLRSTLIQLDTDVGLKIEILRGENLMLSKNLMSSSFLKIFQDREGVFSNNDSVVIDPFVEICCIRNNEDPKNNPYKKYLTQPQSRTSNPIWNETIIINTSDGLHSAHFIQFEVKDAASGITVGVGFIPVSEFFGHKQIKGESKLMKCSILPRKHFPSQYKNYVKDAACDLGFLTLRLQLILETRTCEQRILSGAKVSMNNMNVIPIEVELRSQVASSNVFSSYFLCDCVTSSSLNFLGENDNRIEKFAAAAGCDSLILMPFSSFANNSGDDDVKLMESALLHQFQRRTKRRKLVQNSQNSDIWEDIVIYYFYENQRSSGFGSFSGSYLSGLDRENFTDETGHFPSPYSFDDVVFKPPDGYMWDVQHAQKWTLDLEYTESDKDGWSYGIDFNHLMQRLRRGHSTSKKLFQNVRRRRWQRIAILKEGTPVTSSDTPSSSGEKRVKFGALRREFATQNFGNTPSVHSLFCNERRGIDFSWSSKNLLFFERGKFSNESGAKENEYDDISDVPPPIGFQWDDDSAWEVDKDYSDTDSNGWVYGTDFPSIERSFRDNTPCTSKKLYCCRRQKLNRRIVEVDGPSTPSVSQGQFNHINERFFCDTRTISDTLSQVSVGSREDGFAEDKDKVMKFCQERECDTGPICIPWEQVKYVDVITPSVLSVIAIVNRYIGNENFAPVDVEVFIYECPAEKLCAMMSDRINLLPIRRDISELITSGSVTGGPADEYSYRSEMSDDFTTSSLSFGSTVSKNIFFKIAQIQAQQHKAHIVLTEKKENLTITRWATDEISHMKLLTHRLKLYGQLLLASALTGPDFNELTVSRVVQSDQQIAHMILSQNLEKDKMVQRTQKAVLFLLDTANSRICDYSLCGWEHQGNQFEGIISTLINGYFFSMVEILGFFFDKKDILTSVKGNSDKLSLINFLLEHDDALSMIVDNCVRPYELKVSPQPLLSLSLNIKTLMDWYVVHLKEEILTYVSRSFDLNVEAGEQRNSAAEYMMPWDVLNDQELMLSNIPLDVVMLLKGYFDLLGKADKPSLSFQMRAGLSFLYQKIRVYQVESFALLIRNYRKVLLSHDWATPKLLPTTVCGEDFVFDAMGKHILWLSSIGNDMVRLRALVENFNDDSSLFDEEFVSSREKLFDLSTSTICIGMDFLSCIIFKSFESILPLRNIHQKWVKDRENKNLVQRVVGELQWYLESNIEHLQPSCIWKLSQICLTKFSMWFFMFMKECVDDFTKFCIVDIENLVSDCGYIYVQFTSHMEYSIHLHPDLFPSSQHDSHMRLINRFLQIKSLLIERPGSPELNSVLGDILLECDHFVEKAQSLSQLIQVVFRLRNIALSNVDNDTSDESIQEQSMWFTTKIEMVKTSINLILSTESPTTTSIDDSYPELVVWPQGKISSVADYLTKSANKRFLHEGNGCLW